jgi:serine/threonine-protein kinase
VVALIGSGATAEVFHAEHIWLDRPVALKILPPGDSIERFLDEARVLARLSHPGLVKIYDSDLLAGDGAYLAMELLEGESLQSRLARAGRLTLGEMVDIVGQLAQALEVVHDAGLVHRDLKPSNIFLCGDRVKLLDFGIAKQLGKPRTAPGTLLGTPYYMPPEQCRGEPNVDRRADVYALGAVLYQMAAGRPPFDGDTVEQVIAGHLFHAPPPLSGLAPGLPSRVGEVAAIALAKAPDDRFPCALAMASALAEVRDQGPSTQPMRPVVAPEIVPAKESLPLETIPRQSRAWLAVPVLLLAFALAVIVERLTRPTEIEPPPAIVQPIAPAILPVEEPREIAPVDEPRQVASPTTHPRPIHKRAVEKISVAPEEPPPPAPPQRKRTAAGLLDPFAE